MAEKLFSSAALVSVVIPIYNQARYLGEAIDSVLAQSYPHREIVVVDDGSSDDPASVVSRHPGIRFVRQENAGSAAARNHGIRESHGAFLVFLDADDRLVPDALERGHAVLSARPGCALAYGRARMISTDGIPLPSVQPPHRETDTYAALLERCPIWNPGSAMCSRFVFEDGVAFDTSMAYSSDYLFYLTVARRWPAASHSAVVSEYRQHETNRSSNGAEMMRHLMRALRAQGPFVRSSPRWRAARRRGIGYCRRDYYRPAVRDLWKRLWREPASERKFRDLLMLLAVTPMVLPRLLAGELYRGARRMMS